ncbi:hypothetical protein G5C60_21345 [Streptomyces sp. HC44]|uniref:Uncharacterized protein n=1 Tax=Streptomyces scabichelini TaxID=2711217 RepID=A0A6G4V7Q1_9ACTN|nr:hypothetical protein [Streptomyces scabichelini]NGO10066.1 hypothetical protein [Streptomyces scabichelini]
MSVLPPAGSDNQSPAPSTRSASRTLLIALTAVVVACGVVAFVAWRYPAAVVPFGLAFTLAGVLVPLVVAVYYRR